MPTNEQIEEYLIHTELPYEQVQEGMWLIHDDNDAVDNIVVIHTPPVITFRIKVANVAQVPDERRVELFTTLLRLNATEMVAGAYGLEEDAIVVTDSLQSENLDYNEFQASIDSISMALREHYPRVRALLPDAEADLPEDASLSEKALEDSIMGR